MFVKLCGWLGPENAKHVSSILSYFFSNERSRGLHCYSIKGDSVLLLPVFFWAGKSRFFNVSLQIAPWQGFHNIQPSSRQDTDKETSCNLYVGKTVWKRAPASVGSGQHWRTLADDTSSSMFERTCEKCLSNYVLDFDLKMQTHFASILSYFFSNERSGLHCYSIRGDWVLLLLLSVLFFKEKQVLQCKSTNSTVARFSKYPTQSIQRKAADGA